MPGFDREAVLQVVLQLEIENNNGKSGQSDQAKDVFAKGFQLATYFSLQPPTDYTIESNFVSNDAQHVCAFYPAVPTPPPNC
ncbi:hypothetical protein GCM10007415_16120 [Parapedobacter pyrenivorans]|uniref:Uncharacterized protein n=2 Tax=Parapedobacter pyrenivorans TaxID=1305674 RepID=A0A917HN03_9SPHI|nr:hypothetical protein GCM10007415_16120 [Parapedobacter pyrenivorans]